MDRQNNTWQERFDEQFGIDGPDKDSDSIGRNAGCDDCSENIKLRAEHKLFLKQELRRALQECLPEGYQHLSPVADRPKVECNHCWVLWNACREQFIKNAKAMGIELK